MQQFGTYLVRTGVIDAEQLVLALDYQAAERPRPHATGMKLGLLTAREALRILELCNDQAIPFAAGVAELGYLTPEQVSEVEEACAAHGPLLGELVSRLYGIERAVIECAAAEFHRSQARSSARIRVGPRVGNGARTG